MIQVKLIDRERIENLIDNLQDVDKDKVVKKGLGRAGNIFKNTGRRELRRRMLSGTKGVTGNLMSSFQVRTKRHQLGVLIGFRRSSRYMIVGGGNHAHLVDSGAIRKNRGRMPANYFWRDTKNIEESRAVNEVYVGIQRAMERIERRAK